MDKVKTVTLNEEDNVIFERMYYLLLDNCMLMNVVMLKLIGYFFFCKTYHLFAVLDLKNIWINALRRFSNVNCQEIEEVLKHLAWVNCQLLSWFGQLDSLFELNFGSINYQLSIWISSWHISRFMLIGKIAWWHESLI